MRILSNIKIEPLTTGTLKADADGDITSDAGGGGGGTVDATVIDGSTNAVQGNAVFDALALKSNLASPTFTGVPLAPTAAIGTNTTQLATTAFVHANAGDFNTQRYWQINDFADNTKLDGLVAVTSTGTVANGTPDANHPGVALLTVTAVASRAAVSTSVATFLFGGATWSAEQIVQIPVLSNATNRFQFVVGFADGNTTANQTDGAYFLYDEGGASTGSAASPNWQIVTCSNSVRTYNTSSTAVALATWYRLRVDVNAAASSVSFFINDVQVGSAVTTNIPSGAGRNTGWQALLIKSVGAGSVTALIDYMSVLSGEFTTPR